MASKSEQAKWKKFAEAAYADDVELDRLKDKGVAVDALCKPDREIIRAWVNATEALWHAEQHVTGEDFLCVKQKKALANATDRLIERAKDAGVDNFTLQPFRDVRQKRKSESSAEAFDHLAAVVDAMAKRAPESTGGDGEDNGKRNNDVIPDPVAIAVTLVSKHPHWSARKLAEEVGCAHTTLTRSSLFRRAKLIAQGKVEPRRGSKDADGNIETAANDEEEE